MEPKYVTKSDMYLNPDILRTKNDKRVCVESNFIFYGKEIWSFLKVLLYQILEEFINFRRECSFLSLVQVTPRVQVTPFYGTYLLMGFPNMHIGSK